MNLFRKQNTNDILNENKAHKERTLGVFDLTLMSIGAVIGTGVMVLTGVVAATEAGLGVSLSFIISGIACIFIVLCYAEFSSTLPSSGGSYTYVYASMGEFLAYIVGLCIVLGYTLSVATVGAGWSAYFTNILSALGINLPTYLTTIPANGGIVNLPGILVILFIMFILSIGTKESKKFNNLMVLIKLGVIFLFIIVGVIYINTDNWNTFLPFGFTGVFSGASSVFFAYTGFDTTASAAEETKNPQRTIPIALILSLVISTIIYIIVALILTGMSSYSKLDTGDALAYVLNSVGRTKIAAILSVGAVIGTMAVIFGQTYGSSRVLLSVGRDGLLPSKFAKTNSKNIPLVSIWSIGIVAAILAGFINLGSLANFSNMALLIAYFIVSISVIVFRKVRPDLKRGFRTPLVPLIPILAALSCGFLIFNLPYKIWIYFAIFIVFAVVLYFTYSYKHSKIK